MRLAGTSVIGLILGLVLGSELRTRPARLRRAQSSRGPAKRSSDQVHQREEENPDEVDEVPVEADVLGGLGKHFAPHGLDGEDREGIMPPTTWSPWTPVAAK